MYFTISNFIYYILWNCNCLWLRGFKQCNCIGNNTSFYMFKMQIVSMYITNIKFQVQMQRLLRYVNNVCLTWNFIFQIQENRNLFYGKFQYVPNIKVMYGLYVCEGCFLSATAFSMKLLSKYWRAGDLSLVVKNKYG